MAFSQLDIKRLIAYSSVAHMGFVTLGLFITYMTSSPDIAALAYTGGIIQMIAHAFGSGALFFAFGLIYQRVQERAITKFKGLATQMPWFSMFFLLFVFSTIGVPFTAGFVGEWIVIVSAIQALPIIGIICSLTLVLSAAYLLTMYKGVFFGQLSEIVSQLEDARISEILVLSLVALLIILVGLYPQVLIQE